MYIQRKIDVELLAWQKSSSRKPLLIRGARQVGKSTAVRNLSKQFDYFIEINFDEQSEYQNLFANTSDINDLIEQLAIITQTEIIEGRTLVFLDEIQASLPAISKLRYFYEKKTKSACHCCRFFIRICIIGITFFWSRKGSIFVYVPLLFY